MKYSYTKQSQLSFDDTVKKTRDELKNEGFGVLTEIDVKFIMKKKLDVDFDNYIILGACNPPLALKALQAEKEIGLMLPCNVIIYENSGDVFVSAIMPSVAMGMIENEVLGSLAKEVGVKLIKVIDAVN